MVFLVSFQRISLFALVANISPELHPLQRRCLPRNLLKSFRHKSHNRRRNVELLINMWIFHPRGVFHHQFVWGIRWALAFYFDNRQPDVNTPASGVRQNSKFLSANENKQTHVMNTKKQRLADENLNKFIFRECCFALMRIESLMPKNYQPQSIPALTQQNRVETSEISANQLGDLQLRALL